MAFDIFKNDVVELAEEGYKFAVKTPDGVDTDWVIHVRGSNSKIAKDHARKLFQKTQAEELRNRKRNKETEFNLDDAEAQVVEIAVTRIKGWEGLESDGKVVKFTPEVATQLLTKHDWARKQVIEQSDNEANFI